MFRFWIKSLKEVLRVRDRKVKYLKEKILLPLLRKVLIPIIG